MRYDNTMNVIKAGRMGYISIDDSSSSLSWDCPFSVVLQVKYLLQPDYSILFQKDGFLKLEIIDGYLAISGLGIPDTLVTFSIDESFLSEYQLFAVTYTRSVLKVYHNHSLVQILAVDRNDSTTNNAPIVVGDYFEGYISYFRVFSYALSTYEISEQSNLLTVTGLEDVLFELSAVSGKIECTSREIAIIECEACNLIPCFSFGKYGNIRLIDDTEVNPGGRVNDDRLGIIYDVCPYSIIAEIFFIPSLQQRYYIFSNTNNGADSGMSLYIEKSDDGGHYLYAKIGNCEQEARTVRSASPIPEGQWIRIANTYCDRVLKLIVNHQVTTIEDIDFGNTFMGQSGRCTIGDVCGSDELLDITNFSGYIKHIFVLEEALQDEECAIDNLADLYARDSLVGAYDAQSEQEKNQVGSADIYMSRGVTSMLLENSMDIQNLYLLRAAGYVQPKLGHDSFGVNVWSVRENGKIIFKCLNPNLEEVVIDSIDEIGISDETAWLIEGLLIVIIGVMQLVCGAKVSTSGRTKVVSHLIELIENPYMRTAIQLLCRDVSWPNMLNLFRVIYQTGFLKPIILCLFELNWLNVISIILDIVGMISGTKVVGIVATIAVLSASVVFWISRKPGKPKECSIRLKKVVFLHEENEGNVNPSKSAVFLQTDSGAKEEDYSHFANNRNNVLYVSNQVNGDVEITAEFEVEGDCEYSVSVREENPIYSLTSNEIVISMANKTANFSFSDFKPCDDNLDRKDIVLIWQGKTTNGDIFEIAKSQHRLYFIPKIPAEPISVVSYDEKASPFTSLLDIFFDYRDKYPNELENVRSCLVKALYYSPIFEYQSEHNFGTRSIDDDGAMYIYFQIDLLMKDVKKWKETKDTGEEKVKVNCVDISSIMYYLMHILDDITDTSLLNYGKPLNCYEIRLIGQTNEIDILFCEHCVLTDNRELKASDKKEYRVYDPCLMYKKMVYASDRCGEMMWVKSVDMILPIDTMLCNDEENNGEILASYLRNIQQIDQEVEFSEDALKCYSKLSFDYL